jgi:hypothetical protein
LEELAWLYISTELYCLQTEAVFGWNCARAQREAEMEDEKSGKRKNGNELDKRTITVRLGKGEIGSYDELICELGLSLSALVRTALKLFLWIFNEHKKGGELKIVYPDGSEKNVTILELQGSSS